MVCRIKLHYLLPDGDTSKDYAVVYGDEGYELSLAKKFDHPYGYEFDGWAGGEGGAKLTQPIIYNNEYKNIYAIWNANTEKLVNFNMELLPNVSQKVGTSSGKVDLPLIVDGKNFLKGWSLEPDGEIIQEDTYSPEKDRDLYAVWEEGIVGTPIIVDFEPNGGSGTMPAIASGKTITVPDCEFTPPLGEAFDHWEWDGAPGEQYQPGDKITCPDEENTIVLVANWKVPNSFLCTYYRNQDPTDTVCVSQSNPAGETFFPVSQWEIEGKEFNGWSIDRNEPFGSIFGTYELTGDIEWYATWKNKG